MKPVGIELHAGHGLKVPGAVGILNEVDEARRVVSRVYEILKSWNVPVAYFFDNTSKTQKENLNTLVKWHNQDVNDLVVSIHFNAGGNSNRPIGTEVLYYDQKALAEKLAKAISDATGGGLLNRGAKQRKDLAVLSRTYEPAVLIEVCFVNSIVDAAIYRRDFEKICQAIARVLAEHVGKPQKEVKEDMEFFRPASKDIYEKRKISPATKEFLVKAAVEDLGFKEDWITYHNQGKLKEGDYVALAYELAVFHAKYEHKEG